MKNYVKVSIIVPIYNVKKYLPRCIESITNQTFKDIEIILVDDGSPDNCDQICDEYSLKDDRIRVIHKKNGGVSDARNVGIKECLGEYILMIDSDDWCDNTMVEELYKQIVSDKTDISICGYSIDYTNNNFSVYKDLGEDTKFCGKDKIADAIYKLDTLGIFNVVWNRLYKTVIIRENNLIFEKESTTGEDLLFNCEYFKCINSISFISKKLYHYMSQDEDTLVSKYRENLYEQVQKSNKARKDLYNFYDMDTGIYLQCYANSYIEYISFCIPNIFRKNCNLSIKEKKYFIKELIKNEEINTNIKYFIPQNFYDKLFKIMYSLKKPTIIHIIYSSLFRFRYTFDAVYREIRKQILK